MTTTKIMSIETQLFELHQFAQKKNLKILKKFTEAKSAKKLSRKKFNEMIKKIEQSDGHGNFSMAPG